MAAPRTLSEQPDPQSSHPRCPTCRDTGFVKQEMVVTGGKAVAFWTCTSCLRSWPAPAPRMAKADLERGR